MGCMKRFYGLSETELSQLDVKVIKGKGKTDTLQRKKKKKEAYEH